MSGPLVDQNNVLCILGMHRSGTSLTAGWLQSCGLNIGDDLLRKDHSNEKGHFEDLEFLKIHKKILTANNLPTSGLEIKENIEMSNILKTNLEKLINKKNSKYEQWGWKEPRTCLFLKNYLEIIPKLKVFYIHRPPIHIITSLVNRELAKMWLQTYDESWITKRINQAKFYLNLKDKKRQLLHQYESTLILYYKKIITSLSQMDSANLMVIELEEIINRNKEIFDILDKKWGFKLQFNALSKSFEPKVMGKNTYHVKYIPCALANEYENKLLSFKTDA